MHLRGEEDYCTVHMLNQMDVTRWYPYLSLFLCIVLISHQLGC